MKAIKLLAAFIALNGVAYILLAMYFGGSPGPVVGGEYFLEDKGILTVVPWALYVYMYLAQICFIGLVLMIVITGGTAWYRRRQTGLE